MTDTFATISSLIESARDMTIEAAVSASTRLSETPPAKRPQEISKLLNSRTEREVLNGMKCVMALVSRGEDGSVYFADVVKNVTSANPRLRALVMVFISKYAESEPDTALLSINSFQKSLGDKSTHTRAASIRTLGEIKIPEIASLLLLCIKRTVGDRHPEVRAATALAIGSAFSIDGINHEQLIEQLALLFGDTSPLVVGSAVKVFATIQTQMLAVSAKKTWALLHSNFRRLVGFLRLVDDWSKSVLIDVLTDYCRMFVPRPTLVTNGTTTDLPEDFDSFPENYSCDMDSDIKLFVDELAYSALSVSPLVVSSTLRALMAVSTPEQVVAYGLPSVLVKLTSTSSKAPYYLYSLQLVLLVALSAPHAFHNHIRKFFLHPTDSVAAATCKLQILSVLFSEDTAKVVMAELQYNSGSYRPEVSREAIRAIGYCCQKSPKWTDKILKWCVSVLVQGPSSPVSELLTVVRFLLQQKMSTGSDTESIVRLVYKLSVMLHNREILLDEESKATIIWIVGEFTDASNNAIGPDVIRKSLKDFSKESEKARYELLMLAAKCYSFEIQKSDESANRTICQKMFDHTMNLARYDSSTSVRDKARIFDELFRDPENNQLASLFMQVPKTAPTIYRFHASVAPELARYLAAKPWADPATLPPKSIRKSKSQQEKYTGIGHDSPFVKSVSPVVSTPPASAKSNQLQSLDEFFGNEESESEESVTETESESESESESEEETESEQENGVADESSEASESESD